MSNRVVVKICGEEFALITEDSVEYTQAIGSYVSSEMQKMLSMKMGRMEAAIMAAINIADELFKAKVKDEQLRAQVKSAIDESAQAKAESNALKRENLSLQKKLEKAEKAQSKAEKSLLKVQKAVKSATKGDAAEEEDASPLSAAEMAEIVQKSKRPRKAARKSKADAPEEAADAGDAGASEAAPDASESAVEAFAPSDGAPEAVDAPPPAMVLEAADADTPSEPDADADTPENPSNMDALRAEMREAVERAKVLGDSPAADD